VIVRTLMHAVLYMGTRVHAHLVHGTLSVGLVASIPGWLTGSLYNGNPR
jgi:hypothetical protein